MRVLIPLFVSACLVTGCKDRDEKLQAAEEKGNLLAATKAKMVKGVGEVLKNEGKEAAEVVSEGTGEVVKAVGIGFDKSLEQVKLTVPEATTARGLSATRASRNDGGDGEKKHAISVYLKVEKAYTGPLELRAFDRQSQEIGRARVELDEKAPTAKYVDFDFDPRTPLLTADHFELH
ncbi:MAG: hypothetical protein WBV82_05590 [Myxococcaceae bacterium]